MVLIFDPVISAVIKTRTIGTKLIKIKNKSFSSFKFNFLGIFFISSHTKIKNGIKIPICFNVNINGYLRWLIICPSSKPARAKPYLIVIKSLLNNQIICGIKITKNTSKETKYLKSNFLDFLKNIKYANNKSIAINK